jgi:uncharacterized protein
MNKAIILHGTGGSPEGNWFKWLEGVLKLRGFQVWLPALPNPETPRLSEWSEFVLQNVPFELDSETIVIGHSSGAILALIVAQSLDDKLGAVVCVSAFKDNSFGWDANNNLFDMPFDFAAIKNNAGKLLYIHSDDDPYCPLNQPKYLHQNTDGEFILIPGQGHFNLEKSLDYKQFSRLVEILEERQLL